MASARLTLGLEYKDTITGFAGFATKRYGFLYGCDMYHLIPVPKPETTKLEDGEWFEEQRLVATGRQIEGGLPWYSHPAALVLGHEYRDSVTDFKGIATGRCENLYSCDQYILIPKAKKDAAKTEGGSWFDEGRLKPTDGKRNVTPESVQAKTGRSGGAREDLAGHSRI